LSFCDVCPRVRNLAKIPTIKRDPDAKMHASMKACRDVVSVSESFSCSRTDWPARAYLDSGGKSAVDVPDIAECAAEVRTKGSVMRRLVNASGSENHETGAAATVCGDR